jgi:hypothetical protein
MPLPAAIFYSTTISISIFYYFYFRISFSFFRFFNLFNFCLTPQNQLLPLRALRVPAPSAFNQESL